VNNAFLLQASSCDHDAILTGHSVPHNGASDPGH